MLEIINVLVAAVVAFAAGAVWYMKLAEPWMEAANIKRNADGQPEGAHARCRTPEPCARRCAFACAHVRAY